MYEFYVKSHPPFLINQNKPHYNFYSVKNLASDPSPSNSQYVIARAVFPKQSPIFGREIAHLHCNKRSAAQVSYLAMTFSY